MVNPLSRFDGRVPPPVCGDGDYFDSYEPPLNRNKNILFAGQWMPYTSRKL
jgi:hypothetical protein